MIGLFRMEEDGLIDLPNPGMEFIDNSNADLAGSALSLTIDGNRPLLIEIEALTTHTKFGYPKRSARGINSGKLDLLIAVLSKYTSTKLESSDVYLNVSRGLSISEPGIDLACLAAIISSKKEISLGRRIYLGEVSLTGVIKNTYMMERRISEGVKLGFTEFVIPDSYTGKLDPGLHITRINSIRDLSI
jgi:DNA repair protein RadA/Sms